MTRFGGAVAALVVAILAAGAACSDGGSDEPTGATAAYATAACPDDVVEAVSADISCGYLTVPEVRGGAEDSTVDVFVVRVQPPGKAPADPIVVPGIDLGIVPDLDGLAPMAERTGREVVIIEPRGIGHSRPALDCPELDAIALQLNGRRSDDRQRSNLFVEAVMACRERLTGAGVNPAAYGIDEASADVEDLRKALDIDDWSIVAFGSASRVALEVARQWPDHVRAMVFDAPSFPGSDVRLAAFENTRRAIETLETSCTGLPACADATAGLSDRIAAAISDLDRAPVRLEVPGSALGVPGGPPVEVTVDGAVFARNLRFALSRHTDDGTYLASALRPDSGAAIDPSGFTLLSSDVGLCMGYTAGCPRRVFVAGAFYSAYCADLLPFSDAEAVAAQAASDPIMGAAMAVDPLPAACEAWDVPAADSAIDEPVSSDIPALVLVSSLDPYSSPDAAREATADWAQATVVDFPLAGHNILGGDCARAIRNTFIDDPNAAPDLSCLDE